MKRDITLDELLKLHEFNSAVELSEYIGYLEDVKADYEYLKSKIKSIAGEIDKLY